MINIIYGISEPELPVELECPPLGADERCEDECTEKIACADASLTCCHYEGCSLCRDLSSKQEPKEGTCSLQQGWA